MPEVTFSNWWEVEDAKTKQSELSSFLIVPRSLGALFKSPCSQSQSSLPTTAKVTKGNKKHELLSPTTTPTFTSPRRHRTFPFCLSRNTDVPFQDDDITAYSSK